MRALVLDGSGSQDGGLALGGGGTLNGGSLDANGGFFRNFNRALDLAAGAVAEGREVPQEAVVLAAKPLMPTWLYTTVASWEWRRQAWKNEVLFGIYRRPHGQ